MTQKEIEEAMLFPPATPIQNTLLAEETFALYLSPSVFYKKDKTHVLLDLFTCKCFLISEKELLKCWKAKQ